MEEETKHEVPAREDEEFKGDEVYERPKGELILESLSHEEAIEHARKLTEVNRDLVDKYNKLVDDAEETISERIKDLQQANGRISVLQSDVKVLEERMEAVLDESGNMKAELGSLRSVNFALRDQLEDRQELARHLIHACETLNEMDRNK